MSTKLYSMVPQDSSGKVRWLLNEMGLPFEDISLSYRKGDLATPEFLAKNPIAQVPVLEHLGETMFDSYAIVTYLADKHLDKGFAPDPKNLEARAQYYQWMFYTCNGVENFFNRFYKLPKMTQEYNDQWGEYVKTKIQMIMLSIEKQLEKKDYVLGNFSAVDICLGNTLDMVCEEAFFHDFPKVRSYYERLAKREACVKSEIFKR